MTAPPQTAAVAFVNVHRSAKVLPFSPKRSDLTPKSVYLMLLRRARLQETDIWDAGHSRNVLGEGWMGGGGRKRLEAK